MKTSSLIDWLKTIEVPDKVTDEFYERLEMYEKVSPEQFGVGREKRDL